MDSGAVVEAFGAGAALLGFWIVVRFPHVGPQRILSAIVLAAVAYVAMSGTPALVATVTSAAGLPLALLTVVLPSLTVMFWSAGCVVRACIQLPRARRG